MLRFSFWRPRGQSLTLPLADNDLGGNDSDAGCRCTFDDGFDLFVHDAEIDDAACCFDDLHLQQNRFIDFAFWKLVSLVNLSPT